MPLIMRCDAPGCINETPAITSKDGRIYPAQPNGWWYCRAAGGKALCACDADHLHVVFAKTPLTFQGIPPTIKEIVEMVGKP